MAGWRSILDFVLGGLASPASAARVQIAIASRIAPGNPTTGRYRGRHYVGQRIWIEFDFDVDGAPYDPDAPGLVVTAPDDTDTVLAYGVDDAVERLSAGRYRASWLIATNGTHWYAPRSTAEGEEAASEFWFTGVVRRAS